MPMQGVIFDHDGTLVDSERCHFQIWQAILLKYGHKLDEEEYILKFSGVPTSTNAQYLVENYTLSCDFAKLLDEKLDKTAEYFQKHTAALMPYAEECVKACHKKGLKLAIATGASQDMVAKAIGKSACYTLFSSIATSDRVKRNKPNPDVYELALRELDISANSAIAVEDSPTGIAAAKAAGLLCIAVKNIYSQKQNLNQADFLVNNLGEALAQISKLC